jgi:exodeoxyribonuclease VII small subunit
MDLHNDPAASSQPSPSPQPSEPTQTASFEDAMGELGGIVAGLESGTLGLSESIEAYERGVALVRRLHDELTRAEARVSVLVRIDDEGRPVLAPHGASEPDPAEKRPTKRSARARSARSRPLPGMDEGSDEE